MPIVRDPNSPPPAAGPRELVSAPLRDMCDELVRVRAAMASQPHPDKALRFVGSDVAARDGWAMLPQTEPRGPREVAAFWYPCEGRRDPNASLNCHGTRPELLMGVAQTGS